ncbi:MAG TPA: glycosyltransferase family 2 protein [Candidatus Wildermuthbacteria bacterium]|nr:glycosyltransferase family 2 protein [Candidatus Wildermuthbacteria bacterium]
MAQNTYLTIGRAPDIKDPKDRALFRFFEMLPGILSWSTLIGAVLFSWLAPKWTAFFIIAFVLYWLLRTVYFSFHLRSGYKRMRENEKIDWIERLDDLKDYQLNVSSWRDLYHLVIIPTYKEPYEVVADSIRSLKAAHYPSDRIMVLLAIEEREGEEGVKKAELLREEFKKEFDEFLVTSHPDGIEGEIAGKGANEAWAGPKAKELIDQKKIPHERVIVTSLDADTVVYPEYFGCLSYYYLTTPDPQRTSFQPIPLFLNNVWQANPISKIFSFASTFWHTMNQERPEKLVTFSTHAMSFQALVDVGFKLPNVVSDDSRIFWQCFLRYDGDYKVQPIYYPISMDANAASNFFLTMRNMYLQQRRWAYGVGEIPYFLFGFSKNRKIPMKKKIALGAELLESHWSWATSSFLIFMLGWLPLFLGGEIFADTLLSYNLPRFVAGVLTISMIGLVGSAFLSINLLPQRKPKYGRARLLVFTLQWIFLPLLMIFFTALPALDAQTRWMLGKYMGFWVTPKFRKEKAITPSEVGL